MKKIRNIILFLIITFFSCKKKEEVKMNINEKFIREWESVKTIIPHKDYLLIKSDQTFEFHGGACTSFYESFGKWKVVNDTLILNSNKSKKCQYVNGFGDNFEAPKKDEIFETKTTINNCNPENENCYVNFINDKFYIKNDTLKYVTKIKLPFNITNDFLPRKKTL